jgi:hypothetical protein
MKLESSELNPENSVNQSSASRRLGGTDEIRNFTLADPVPAAALGGGHHAVHAAHRKRQQPHFHRRDCGRLHPHLAFIAPTASRAGEPSVNWLTIGGLNVDFGLKLDALSLMMLLIVTGVGGAIHIYSYGYMDEDRSKARFFAFMSLFTFSMLGIVLANNF